MANECVWVKACSDKRIRKVRIHNRLPVHKTVDALYGERSLDHSAVGYLMEWQQHLNHSWRTFARQQRS